MRCLFRQPCFFSELQSALLGAKKLQESQQLTSQSGHQICHRAVKIPAGLLCIFLRSPMSGALASSQFCSVPRRMGVTCLHGKKTATGFFLVFRLCSPQAAVICHFGHSIGSTSALRQRAGFSQGFSRRK